MKMISIRRFLLLKFVLAVFLSFAASAADITAVLEQGQELFDPWNTNRWADWYEQGRLVKPFTITKSVTFAPRDTDWQPDVSQLSARCIFRINTGGDIVVDGSGLVIDVRNPQFRNQSLHQAFLGGSVIRVLTLRDVHCFLFSMPQRQASSPAKIRGFTIRGFVQAIRTSTRQSHPLIIENITLHRNRWGVYLSGKNTVVTGCNFIENAGGGMYSGSGSNTNVIRGNSYRDNAYVKEVSYGDIVLDTAYNTLIENNRFMPHTLKAKHFSAAVSMYRNMGEDGNLREDAPHNNKIRNNTIQGRQVGVHIGARLGKRTKNDVSLEGRDYCFDNTVENNHFEDTTVGIKVNTPANTICSNTFVRVAEPIVLHCVFYNLIENVIEKQNPKDVRFWFKPQDYKEYRWLFPNHSDLSRHIDESEKLIHIKSHHKKNRFDYSGSATVIECLSLADYGSLAANNGGASPIAAIVGDFYENLAGEEIAVIWDKPISKISGQFFSCADYYTITIYDHRGIEINRCGRSKTKWSKIYGIDFIADKQGREIAAIEEQHDKNTNPKVNIFRRGYAEPVDIIENIDSLKLICNKDYKVQIVGNHIIWQGKSTENPQETIQHTTPVLR